MEILSSGEKVQNKTLVIITLIRAIIYCDKNSSIFFPLLPRFDIVWGLFELYIETF